MVGSEEGRSNWVRKVTDNRTDKDALEEGEVILKIKRECRKGRRRCDMSSYWDKNVTLGKRGGVLETPAESGYEVNMAKREGRGNCKGQKKP